MLGAQNSTTGGKITTDELLFQIMKYELWTIVLYDLIFFSASLALHSKDTLWFLPPYRGKCSAYELCFYDQADWEGCFGQLYNGRTSTPAWPMHRSQQPIKIGYT